MNLSEILDKIEPHLSQEELALVGGMELQIQDLENQLDHSKTKITRLTQTVDNLEEEVRELEGNQDDAEKLKLFADPANWNGNHFCPVLNVYATDSPYDLCS